MDCHASRTGTNKGGGIAVVYNHTYKVKQMKNLKKCISFEYGIWKIVGKKLLSLVVLAIYHPPYSKKIGLSNICFILEFLDLLTEFIPLYKNCIITGDFNIHVDDGCMLNYNITAMGFNQYVRFPTHSCGHTLDLLIRENHNDLKVISCSVEKFISDHCAVEFTMNVKKENILSETKTFRCVKDLDLELLTSLFGNI